MFMYSLQANVSSFQKFNLMAVKQADRRASRNDHDNEVKSDRQVSRILKEVK